MTEDQEFEFLEARLAARVAAKMCKEEGLPKAVVAAQRFVEDNQNDLGIFTLRKAFEMGYLSGYLAAKRGE
jgi:hydroxymethylpyrimidine/phosphomethylpyrimidine kinase